jgi:hypothetical protein
VICFCGVGPNRKSADKNKGQWNNKFEMRFRTFSGFLMKAVESMLVSLQKCEQNSGNIPKSDDEL